MAIGQLNELRTPLLPEIWGAGERAMTERI